MLLPGEGLERLSHGSDIDDSRVANVATHTLDIDD